METNKIIILISSVIIVEFLFEKFTILQGNKNILISIYLRKKSENGAIFNFLEGRNFKLK